MPGVAVVMRCALAIGWAPECFTRLKKGTLQPARGSSRADAITHVMPSRTGRLRLPNGTMGKVLVESFEMPAGDAAATGRGNGNGSRAAVHARCMEEEVEEGLGFRVRGSGNAKARIFEPSPAPSATR